MRDIGRIIVEAIRRRDEPAAQARLAAEVARIVDRFPVPGLARRLMSFIPGVDSVVPALIVAFVSRQPSSRSS